MNSLNRRTFLKYSGAAAMVYAAGLPFGCAKKTQTTMPWKYAMCNESLQQFSWEKQCEIIGNAGYTGVEIATFTLVENSVSELSSERRQQMVRAMQDNDIECAGLHWLLSPPPKGLHFTTPDAKVRQRTVEYLDQLIDFCGDLNGEVMVFGSPNQRSTVKGATVEETTKYFADGLAKVADHARERGVKILIEPLDKSQTNVVNTLAQAAKVAEMVDHPAIDLIFDFHNTKDETESFETLVKKYYDQIQHVHVQEMDGQYLGTGDAVNEYVSTFQLLKDLAYDKWVSLEVFDFSPGGEKIARESMKVLKQIESKLI